METYWTTLVQTMLTIITIWTANRKDVLSLDKLEERGWFSSWCYKTPKLGTGPRCRDKKVLCCHRAPTCQVDTVAQSYLRVFQKIHVTGNDRPNAVKTPFQ